MFAELLADPEIQNLIIEMILGFLGMLGVGAAHIAIVNRVVNKALPIMLVRVFAKHNKNINGIQAAKDVVDLVNGELPKVLAKIPGTKRLLEAPIEKVIAGIAQGNPVDIGVNNRNAALLLAAKSKLFGMHAILAGDKVKFGGGMEYDYKSKKFSVGTDTKIKF